MLLGLLVGVLLSLIVSAVARAVAEDIPFLQIAQATGSLAVGISAIVGLFLYEATVKKHKYEGTRNASKVYLSEAVNILERAYDIFTDKGCNIYPPRNNRLLWLTTARMFLRYYRIKQRISQDDHCTIVKEHEEYWRVQFYNILDRNKSNFDLRYFQPSGNKYHGDNIQRDSIGVIFDFARWYDDSEDPLPNTDVISMYAKDAVPSDQVGVQEFIEQYDQYFAKIQERKKELDRNH